GNGARHGAPALLEQVELELRFDVEQQDAGVERAADLLAMLADAGEHDARGAAPGRAQARELTAADDVEPGSQALEQPQDRAVRVALDGEAHERVRTEGARDAREPLLDRRARVDVERRAEAFDELACRQL